jgi:signal transduction histidine kinase
LVHAEADKRGITIQIDDLVGPPLVLRTDRARIKKIVLNLLSNAIKYNRQDGTVTIKCEATAADKVRIRVADTGEGIAADQRDEVFEAFNRLGRETGTVEGTGIGLRVTKQLVELLGGSIDFTSQVGIGTEFWIGIPFSTIKKANNHELTLVVTQDRR